MKELFSIDPWSIIEEGFDKSKNTSAESIFSIGNGLMGQRANFEEQYSGDTFQGNYLAGIYYPDKTRVGWWKNGYPEYFAKVLNSPNWIGIDITIDGEALDLDKVKVLSFRRELNMKEGWLERIFSVELANGTMVDVQAKRFVSMDMLEVGAIEYTITPKNKPIEVVAVPYIDGNVYNHDANYDEKFWEKQESYTNQGIAYLETETLKTHYRVGVSTKSILTVNDESVNYQKNVVDGEKVGHSFKVNVDTNQTMQLHKYVAITTSFSHDVENLSSIGLELLQNAITIGFDGLLDNHKKYWATIWNNSDIIIKGDEKAQQGIRFNIFHMNQTYTGKDSRLNIGPKGFTGEKYGGSTYWDTEAYCIPFYLVTSPQEVSRNLLKYRYNHLPRAIENAQKLGFDNGAALYPMVTMNGEECHNEWEITFEEIHRNGAMAYAIFNYILHTGDEKYLEEYGLEVLIGVSRFWKQRIHFSEDKQQYVMHGVTGPNEYENNVTNNWYTNRLATWTLRYTLRSLETVKKNNLSSYESIVDKTDFDEMELPGWVEIIDKMYYPFDSNSGVFLQQDNYLDKEQMMAGDIPADQRPINQHWSWDRILRSCFIKQADVLQGIYLFENEFSDEEIRKNFYFYEPRTVHESSLSPCIHAILASKLGDVEKAYEMYLRTSRLDLDDYNKEVHEGLHITSMAGTYLSVVEGFGGKRILPDGTLSLNPILPNEWDSYTFNLLHRGVMLSVTVNEGNQTLVKNHSGTPLDIILNDEKVTV